jgi:hypothetical protein
LHLDPFQAQFLRYLFGLLVLLPLVARSGKPAGLVAQVGARAVHPRRAAHRRAGAVVSGHCRAFRWPT